MRRYIVLACLVCAPLSIWGDIPNASTAAKLSRKSTNQISVQEESRYWKQIEGSIRYAVREGRFNAATCLLPNEVIWKFKRRLESLGYYVEPTLAAGCLNIYWGA